MGEMGKMGRIGRIGTIKTIKTNRTIRTIRTNGIDGIDGIDGKFPSSEAPPSSVSVTHRAKRPHQAARSLRLTLFFCNFAEAKSNEQ